MFLEHSLLVNWKDAIYGFRVICTDGHSGWFSGFISPVDLKVGFYFAIDVSFSFHLILEINQKISQKRKDKLSLYPEPTHRICSPEITYCTDLWREHYENFPFLQM